MSQWRDDMLAVAGPRPQVGQRDHEHQRAGVVGVVGGVRIQVQDRQRSGPDLVGNASWLFVPPVIEPVALQPTELDQALPTASGHDPDIRPASRP